MSDYISREALITEFKRLSLGENGLIERIFADGVYAVIETFPVADVEIVVRCKDCFYSKNDSCVHGENYTTYDPNWFCADGYMGE